VCYFFGSVQSSQQLIPPLYFQTRAIPGWKILSSSGEETKLNPDASTPLQQYREVLLVLAERSVSVVAPSPGAKLSVDDAVRFDRLVSSYAALLPVFEIPSNAAYAETALLGLKALRAGQIQVANLIYEDVIFATSNVTSLLYVLRGIGLFIAIAFILALIAAFVVFLVALHPEAGTGPLFTWDWAQGLFTPKIAHALVGTVSGCVGGVISLLLRLPEFEILKNKSRLFLTAIGATQPFVGGVFALVLGSLISAKIINISVGGASEPTVWFYIVVGFLAGFSERFTTGILRAAESQLGGGVRS
jgi:hypothetical protein